MNQSDLTRREQVLAYLRARTGLWVDGPELANEKVGGSEGLKRVRELRAEGLNVQTRKHPDPTRDIFQYRIVPGRAPVDPLPQIISDEGVRAIEEAIEAHRDDPPVHDYRPQHRIPVDHVRERELRRTAGVPPPPPPTGKIRDAIKVKEDGTFEYVPPQRALVDDDMTLALPDQPVVAEAKYDFLPKHLTYGSTAICPRCRSKTTRGRTKKEVEDTRKKKEVSRASLLIDEEGVLLFRDPHSAKAKPCERCNGYGIIPNVGVIPFTAPDKM